MKNTLVKEVAVVVASVLACSVWGAPRIYNPGFDESIRGWKFPAEYSIAEKGGVNNSKALYVKREKSGKSVVIVSHSMEDMAMYCDTIDVMSHGELIMHGNCKEVFSKKQMLTDAGLDVPEITTVMHLLNEKGIDIPTSIYTVDGALCAIKEYLRGDKNGL